MKSITKSGLAQLMGISNSTLQNYLNNLWYEKLKETGYYKRQKILSSRQLNLIKELWGEFID